MFTSFPSINMVLMEVTHITMMNFSLGTLQFLKMQTHLPNFGKMTFLLSWRTNDSVFYPGGKFYFYFPRMYKDIVEQKLVPDVRNTRDP